MTLTQRNGTLWVTFYHQSQRIRKSLKLDDTKVNRKFATNHILPELRYKLNSGEFFNNKTKQKVPTVNEFSQISFELHRKRRNPFTKKEYKGIYEQHIKPIFGKRRIDTIKTSELQIWQNKLLDALSPKRVGAIRTVFNTFFKDANNDDIIAKNPFLAFSAPPKDTIKEKNPFTKKEMFLILDEVQANKKSYFAIGFFTGARPGEIIGLKWEDVNFKKKKINIVRRIRDANEDVPKKHSIREIDIIDVLMPYLKKHRKLYPNSTYVFETYKNKPYASTAKIGVSYWTPTLKKLKIIYRNPYQMRHTFASQMISNGEDILWVSHMLGHKDSVTTLKEYARYIQNDGKKRGLFLKNSVTFGHDLDTIVI